MYLRLSISTQSEKSPGSNIVVSTRGESLAFAAFYCELHTRISHKILEMFELLWINVLGIPEFLLGSFHGEFDGMFVNFLLGNGVFGKDTNLISVDLGKTATDREKQGFSSLGDAKLSIVNLGEKWNVARKHADFAVDRRYDDGINGVGVHLRFGRDDFECEGHGSEVLSDRHQVPRVAVGFEAGMFVTRYFFPAAAMTSSMPPFM